MPRDILLDHETLDLKITNFNIELSEGLEAIRQEIAIRLQFFLGTWFLNRGAGIPYYQDVFIKNANSTLLESLTRDAIEDTPGVNEVTEIDVQVNTLERKANISFTVLTENGELDTNVNLVLN